MKHNLPGEQRQEVCLPSPRVLTRASTSWSISPGALLWDSQRWQTAWKLVGGVLKSAALSPRLAVKASAESASSGIW